MDVGELDCGHIKPGVAGARLLQAGSSPFRSGISVAWVPPFRKSSYTSISTTIASSGLASAMYLVPRKSVSLSPGVTVRTIARHPSPSAPRHLARTR